MHHCCRLGVHLWPHASCGGSHGNASLPSALFVRKWKSSAGRCAAETAVSNAVQSNSWNCWDSMIFLKNWKSTPRTHSSGLRACWEFRYVSRDFELGFWGFGRNIGWFTIKNWDTNQSITINGLVSMDLFWRNHDFLRSPWNGETRLYIILYPIWLHQLCGPFAEGFTLSVPICYMVASIVWSMCWRIYAICSTYLFEHIQASYYHYVWV